MTKTKRNKRNAKVEYAYALSFNQSYHENRAAFIARLQAAGWDEGEALLEWNKIQADEESNDFVIRAYPSAKAMRGSPPR